MVVHLTATCVVVMAAIGNASESLETPNLTTSQIAWADRDPELRQTDVEANRVGEPKIANAARPSTVADNSATEDGAAWQ